MKRLTKEDKKLDRDRRYGRLAVEETVTRVKQPLKTSKPKKNLAIEADAEDS